MGLSCRIGNQTSTFIGSTPGGSTPTTVTSSSSIRTMRVRTDGVATEAALPERIRDHRDDRRVGLLLGCREHPASRRIHAQHVEQSSIAGPRREHFRGLAVVSHDDEPIVLKIAMSLKTWLRARQSMKFG